MRARENVTFTSTLVPKTLWHVDWVSWAIICARWVGSLVCEFFFSVCYFAFCCDYQIKSFEICLLLILCDAKEWIVWIRNKGQHLGCGDDDWKCDNGNKYLNSTIGVVERIDKSESSWEISYSTSHVFHKKKNFYFYFFMHK